MSPLRQRMIEDMTMRKLAPKTQQHYIQIIKNLAVFLGRSPDTASFEDIRRFQLHVAASGVGVGVINRTASALRFFFRVTLGRYAIVEHTHFIHEPRKLPVVLSPEEVARLLKAAPGLKYKAALSVAYGAGLRAAEVVALKVEDIDSGWIASIGLDPHLFGTHSLRRTKAALIYRRTGNLRAVQLLLGHTKIESTIRYLGIEVDDAIAIAEQVDI